MRFDGGKDSPDLIDKRGERGVGGGGALGGIGGLIGLLPLLRSPIGWVILLVVGVIYVFGHGLLGGGGGQSARGGAGDSSLTDKEQVKLVSFVLDDTQMEWTQLFHGQKTPYRHAKLVLFTDSTDTGCGYGQSATGPFYCPKDERVYIDLGFFHELDGKLGAKGDFAKAYVVAHEIGHHVQKVLGITDRVDSMRGSGEGASGSSVRVELQADCFAGVWANTTNQRKLLENGDIESALGAAAAIGDDRLQRQSSGTVSPETFTHGTSEQRVRWFTNGFKGGSIDSCDTFGAASL